MNKKSLITGIIFILCVILCLIYLKSKVTYTAYHSNVEGNFSLPISRWDIIVDGKSLNTLINREVTLENINWDATHVREGKVAIGSVGDINIKIDPSETGVAIKYVFRIIDKNQDEDKILTLHSVTSTNSTITRTAVNEYTGVISIDDIRLKKKPLIVLNVEWIDDDDYEFNPDEEIDTTNFLDIEFIATQYRGEPIVEYSE